MLKENPEMDDNALLAELERNLESEYGSDTQSVDSLSEIRGLRSSSTNSPATQSAESSLSNRSKRNSIEDLFSSEKVQNLEKLVHNWVGVKPHLADFDFVKDLRSAYVKQFFI